MNLTKEDIKNHIKESCLRRGIQPGINEAMLVASYALLEARDKSKVDYALHWTQVAFDGTESHIKKQIGILHDVIEDTDWTLQDLRELGFDSRVIAGVDAMTRREGKNATYEGEEESYFEFIERCSQDPYAIDVKLNDLRHNMSQSRNNFVMGVKHMERLNKYMISYQYLVAVKQGGIEAGTPVESFASAFLSDELVDGNGAVNVGKVDIIERVFEKEGRAFQVTPQQNSVASQFSQNNIK